MNIVLQEAKLKFKDIRAIPRDPLLVSKTRINYDF